MPFPYSLFTGLTAPQPTSPFDRRDLLNYTGDNTIQSARYIDPVTHDFVVSSNNHLEGENAVEQAVLLALSTTFNSSAQAGFGQNFGAIKTITPTMQDRVTSTIQAALANLTSNNQITIQDIQFTNNAYGQISVQVVYHNNTLATNQPVMFLLQP